MSITHSIARQVRPSYFGNKLDSNECCEPWAAGTVLMVTFTCCQIWKKKEYRDVQHPGTFIALSSLTVPCLHKLCTPSHFCSLGKWYEFGGSDHHTAYGSVTSKWKQCPRYSKTKIKNYWQAVWFGGKGWKWQRIQNTQVPVQFSPIHPILNPPLPIQCLQKENSCLNYWTSDLCLTYSPRLLLMTKLRIFSSFPLMWLCVCLCVCVK